MGIENPSGGDQWQEPDHENERIPTTDDVFRAAFDQAYEAPIHVEGYLDMSQPAAHEMATQSFYGPDGQSEPPRELEMGELFDRTGGTRTTHIVGLDQESDVPEGLLERVAAQLASQESGSPDNELTHVRDYGEGINFYNRGPFWNYNTGTTEDGPRDGYQAPDILRED